MSIIAAPAAAAPDWRQAREVEVLLSNLDIQPETIRLKAGQPVRLRFVNNSHIPHSFGAGGFFRKAEYRNRDKGGVGSGSVQVGPGDTLEVVLVPVAGRYSASCSNLYHRIMGMRARIIVE
jgi:plastocyanin